MKRLARTCLAGGLLVSACSIYDYEGLALVNPKQTIVIGDTVRLIVVDHEGTMPPASSVAWSTSDTTIAVVGELGVVRGTGPGVAQIRAVTGDYSLTVPIKVWEPARLTSVQVGAAHTCGLDAEGRAWCWGSNLFNQLGSRFAPSTCETAAGDFPCAKSAVLVPTELRLTAIVAGYYHVCGLAGDGTAHCWGSDDAGQLGDGADTIRAVPRPVDGGHAFRALAAGGRTTCGITTDERLLCWGASGSRALGDADRPTPTEIAPALRFDWVAIGISGDHICGIATTGATWCWGANHFGQLGVDGVPLACPPGEDQYPCTSDPVEVVAAPTLDQLAAGGAFTCGLSPDGHASCWGRNERGQVGDGSGVDGWQPRSVAGGHAFTALSAAADRACGVADAALRCWGFDGYDFGNGGGRDGVEALEPIAAGGGLTVIDVSVGLGHVCAEATDGLVWCWGAGSLGSGVYESGATEPLRVVLFDYDDTY